MAFVNLPPNLQDMFAALSDRISKLETAPSKAMSTAETAQSTASGAQGSAAYAQALAESAEVDAAAAQAAAATALAKANTAVIVSSDTIVNASNQLTGINGNGITVYSGASSSSGARVILNSAGLAAYNSSNSATFALSSATGSIAMTGSIITGGDISGATITGGVVQTSTSGNAVVLNGNDNALGIKSGGAYAGWIASIGSGSVLMHYGSTPSSSAYPRTAASSSAATLSGSASSGFSANSNGTNGITGSSTFFAGVTMQGSVTMGTSNTFEYLSSSGTLRSLYTYGKAVTGRAMQINSAGDFGTTASTQRKKHEIESYRIDSEALLQLDVKSFKYLESIDEDQKIQHGFIAEEAQALGLDELIQYDADGIPDYFAYEKLPIFLLQLIQEQNERIKALEAQVNQ